MKLIILKTNLKEGLDVIGRMGSDGGTNLPILKNFLIETAENKIKLSATNLEMAATCFVSGKIIEGGEITAPLVTFSSIINNLQSERINLETENDNLIIKTDNYEAKIQGIKKEEFPIIPQINKEGSACLEINSSLLRDALNFVTCASQISELRPELNGVLFDFQVNVLKLAATDSFRLAEKTINEDQYKAEAGGGFKAIVPLKTANEVVRIFKNTEDRIRVYFDNSQVFFRDDNADIISRLINGDFPDYRPIVPKETKIEATLNREELIGALKLTGSFTDRLNEARILIKDRAKNIEIYSFTQGLGENRYLIPAKIKGGPMEAVFNWRFLLDGLKNLNSESVCLGLNTEDRPAMIKSPGDDSLFYILMPIKAA